MSRAVFDLVVVGAGAAGLAAARTALASGLTVVVLEAKGRIGGRAHTEGATFGVPWDRGAHWLHHASHNPFTAFADAEGFAYDRTTLPRRLWSGGWAGADLQAELDAYYARAFAAIAAAGAAGLDVAASEVIPPHPRFRAMFDSWSAALSGADPERVSTLDYARYEMSGGNWRVVDGFGALVARFGQGLPVERSTRAQRIRWGGREVVVETARGALRGRTVIVTASTNVLASGRIAFAPPLPSSKQEALAAIPLGEANKVALALDGELPGPAGPYHLHIEHRTHEAIRFELRTFGRNLAIGYLGGRFAAELEAAGPRAMVAFATDQLAQVFGADLRKQVRAAAATGWVRDPDILGGYSCALPGMAHLRPLLAEPLAGRVFFAGEACSLEAFGTVHGARASGEAAARAAA
ncbi:MAG: flavin monoamine oxidase family protein, partial [Geminicoccaceae bacterium]